MTKKIDPKVSAFFKQLAQKRHASKTPEERKAHAKKMAEARWGKKNGST